MKLPLHISVCALALTAFTTPGTAEAALGPAELPEPILQADPDGAFLIARGENSGSGSENSGRGSENSGRGGGDRDDDNHDRDDDRGREDEDDSGSGRDKPRVPGGSGCDDPGDVEEHAECQV